MIFKFLKNNSRFSGFTIVEMLVILAVSSFLIAMVIFYTKGSEKNIILITEQSKLLNTLLRAKSLSIQTFNQPAPDTTSGPTRPCGYGVHFLLPRKYILFKDLPSSGSDCSTSDQKWTNLTENLEVIILNSNLEFKTIPIDVLFIPPDPKVILRPSGPEAVIEITTLDKALTAKVQVTQFGQIGAQR